jgi:N-acylneuraminate cytidylyltransferase
MKVLGVVPARGGSKGVPRKNIKPLGGKSLIQRAYECGLASGVLDRIILSTDSLEIAELSRYIGLEVPFIRPLEYASDNSSMIDVVIHAVGALEETGYRPDAIALLQPTCPLRKPEHIIKAVSVLKNNDSVCSVTTLPIFPHYIMRIGEDGFLKYLMTGGEKYTRRQDVPKVYLRVGVIYLTRTSVIMEQKSFYGTKCAPIIINYEDSLNIDSLEDWSEAERLLQNNNKNN